MSNHLDPSPSMRRPERTSCAATLSSPGVGDEGESRFRLTDAGEAAVEERLNTDDPDA